MDHVETCFLFIHVYIIIYLKTTATKFYMKGACMHYMIDVTFPHVHTYIFTYNLFSYSKQILKECSTLKGVITIILLNQLRTSVLRVNE